MLAQETITQPFPDHTQLPESDGTFVKNFQEHPQSLILTDSILPILQQVHSDGQFVIGQDCGIYWRETDPPEKGAEAPDWFYVPNVPPLLEGKVRRSYVLRREFIAPLIALEFASGDGSEERDRTALSVSNGVVTKPGKFWVYEQVMRIAYYGIYIVNEPHLEMYHHTDGKYERMLPNERGHYQIHQLQVELGLWEGSFLANEPQSWVRWWNEHGELLLTGDERAQKESLRLQEAEQRVEQEKQRAEQAEMLLEEERQQRQQLLEKLKALSPEQLKSLGFHIN